MHSHAVSSTGSLLSRLGQDATAAFAEVLGPHGVRPRHVGLLGAVADAPDASQREIGELLGLVPSAVVPTVDDLEALGALRRVVDPRNRRRHVLELTPAGRDLLATAHRLADAVDADLLAALPAKERRHLHAVLQQLLTDRRPAGQPRSRPSTEGPARDLAGFPGRA